MVFFPLRQMLQKQLLQRVTKLENFWSSFRAHNNSSDFRYLLALVAEGLASLR